MRLLVVEDEADLVSALKVGLSRAGHAVDTALTVAEAGPKLAVQPYDLVVLDLMLPARRPPTRCPGFHTDFRSGGAGCGHALVRQA